MRKRKAPGEETNQQQQDETGGKDGACSEDLLNQAAAGQENVACHKTVMA